MVYFPPADALNLRAAAPMLLLKVTALSGWVPREYVGLC
jgi:hypothetical protein